MRVMAGCVVAMMCVSRAAAEPVATPVAAAVNLDFEQGTPGEAPAGWLVPPAVRDAGWSVKLVEGPSASGSRHAVLALDREATHQGFGNVMQGIDATALRGRIIRLSGRGRVEGGARLQLWLRDDRAGGSTGFFDNCNDRPILTADWSAAEIVGVVDADAEAIAFGALVLGGGTAHVDAMRLETLDVARPTAEAARALSPRGLENVQAFARLYGVVRFFHASDEVAAADWDRVAIDGVRRVEGAADAPALASALEGVFRPLAPTLRAFPTGAAPTDLPDLSKPAEATRTLAWVHAGVGLGDSRMGPYSSRRVTPEDVRAVARLPGQIDLHVDASSLHGRSLHVHAFARAVPAAGATLRIQPAWYATTASGQIAGMSPEQPGGIDAPEWTAVETTLTIPADARDLFVGFRATGEGRAFVDDVRVDIAGEPFAIAGLDVTDFDASGQVDDQPLRGWLSEEAAPGPGGWRSSISSESPHSPPRCALLETVPIERPTLPDPSQPFVLDLPGGVTCRLPLAVYADAQRTLPRGVLAAPTDPMERLARTTDDRATRLAAVIIAWNVMQHFYPYFDVVDTNWDAVLPQSLSAAATDADARAFGVTLRRLAAALQDGHVRVSGIPDDLGGMLPIDWDVVENALVVTAGPAATDLASIHVGDVITTIDGEPALAALEREEALISGATPGWRRHRALAELLRAPVGRVVHVDLVDAAGEGQAVDMRAVQLEKPVEETRPSTVEEVRAGIVYVDLDRATDAELDAAMPLLDRADGIVFDLRGYPAGSTAALSHLTDVPLMCARWNVPVTAFPDRSDVTWQRSRWPVMPRAPHWKAKVAFVTDGGAISYAETYLAIVEAYHLGEIVGAETAGTNGNINFVPLPGGLSMSFTGMKVLKHDGSRHHGVGVLPTVPVSRTIAGVRAGRDELLEKAIEVVSGAPASAAEQP
jgi:C-terminal processing protease CtpA/Prc